MKESLKGDVRSGRSTPPNFKDVVTIAFLSSLGPFAANAYVPAFGEISSALSADMVAVQQTLSVYLFAFAVASLLIGALSDACGRKIALGGSMLLFAAASFGAMTADSIEALYLWRLLMGASAAAGPVVTQAIVRDRWGGVDAARVIGLIAIIFGLAPALAPIIGGYLTVAFGWRSVFVFLCALSSVMTLVTLVFLRETLPKEKRSDFRPLKTLSRYGTVLKEPAFTAGVVAHGFIFMGLIVYSAGAADFVLNVLGLGVDEFGWLMIPLVVAGMTGSWCSPRLLGRFGLKPLMCFGLAALAASSVFAIVVDDGPLGVFPWVLAGPVLYNFSAAAIRPAINVANLDYFPKSRGLSASVQQFFQTGAFAVSSALLVPIVMGSAMKYAMVMLGSSIAASLLWIIVLKTRDRALSAACRDEP